VRREHRLTHLSIASHHTASHRIASETSSSAIEKEEDVSKSSRKTGTGRGEGKGMDVDVERTKYNGAGRGSERASEKQALTAGGR